MCVEKKFWYYIQRSKDICLFDEKGVKFERISDLNIKNNQLYLEVKENNNEVLVFIFDDYECDFESGVCMRKSFKLVGIEYVF